MTLQNTLKFVAAIAALLVGMRLGNKFFPQEQKAPVAPSSEESRGELLVGPEDFKGTGARWDAFASLDREVGVGTYLILDLIPEEASGTDVVLYDGRRMPVVRESSGPDEAMQVSTCVQLTDYDVGELRCLLTSEAASTE